MEAVLHLIFYYYILWPLLCKLLLTKSTHNNQLPTFFYKVTSENIFYDTYYTEVILLSNNIHYIWKSINIFLHTIHSK